MKKYGLAPAVVLGLCVLLVASFATRSGTSQTATDAGTGWQHMAIQHDVENGFNDAEVSRQIVRFGAEGWELVDVASLSKDGTTMQLIYCFKRPK